MSQEEAFEATVKGLQGMEEGPWKNKNCERIIWQAGDGINAFT